MTSDLQPFELSKQPHYLRLNFLFFGEIRDLIATLYQFLDLLLDLFLLRLGLFVLNNVVLIVHVHDLSLLPITGLHSKLR